MNNSKERDFLFDNIKGFLIILVVLGHVIENYAYHNMPSKISFLYQLIYIFHMPLFVFISGYFSKKDNPKKLAELLIIYGFFQIIFFPLVGSFIKGETYIDNISSFFKPKFTYWYILSLIGWRVLNPVLMKIKFILPLSIVAGILVGLTPGNDALTFMSVGRSVSFYPFFLVGYLTTKDNIESIRNKVSFKKAFLFLILSTTVAFLFFNVLSDFLIKENLIFKILFGKDRYLKYLTNPNAGVLFRLCLYLIQFSFVYVIICLFTSKKTILFKLSLNSLFIYLTHGVIVESLEFKYYKVLNISNMDCVSFLIISLVASLAYCLLLSFNPISKIGGYITKLPKCLLVDENKEIQN